MIAPKKPSDTTQHKVVSTVQGFEPLLTSREAAALLHMHHKTLERRARQKEVPAYFYNGRWYFRTSELDAWLRAAVHYESQSVR
jgi:excisionase family DNA binding protein